jgi:hypothetical protein
VPINLTKSTYGTLSIPNPQKHPIIIISPQAISSGLSFRYALRLKNAETKIKLATKTPQDKRQKTTPPKILLAPKTKNTLGRQATKK